MKIIIIIVIIPILPIESIHHGRWMNEYWRHWTSIRVLDYEQKKRGIGATSL